MMLYLIRHPRPEIEAGICYGRTDLAVSDEAMQTALDSLTGRLPQALPLFTSPLQRCRRFARLLAHGMASSVLVVDERLAEMHFGHWEMQRWDAIPRAEIDAWAADPARFRPQGGESVLEAAARLRAFLNERRAADESAVVVCHAGSIRLLLACSEYASDAEAALAASRQRLDIPFGGLILLA
jgi:alpha-ribazole phosphatase